MNGDCRDVASDCIGFMTALTSLEHFFHSGGDRKFAQTLIDIIDKHGDDSPYTRETREEIKEGFNLMIHTGHMPAVPNIGPWKEFRDKIFDASLDSIEKACKK